MNPVRVIASYLRISAALVVACTLSLGLALISIATNSDHGISSDNLGRLIPSTIVNKWVNAHIRVETAVLQQGDHRRFSISVQRLEGSAVDQALWSQKILARISHKDLINSEYSGILQPGCHYHVKIRLREPLGSNNPGVFSYTNYLARENITGIAKLKSLKRASVCNASLTYAIEEHRQQIAEFIRKNPVITREESSDFIKEVLLALAIGERGGLSAHDRSLIQRNGLSHLLAISGLHVGLVAILSARACLLILTLLSFVPMPGRRNRVHTELPLSRGISMALSLGIASYYTCLAGLPPSALRALCFISLLYLLKAVRADVSLWTVLITSFTVLLLIDPKLLQEIGFWLSFFAVACIAFYQNAHSDIQTRHESWPKRALRWTKAYLTFQLLMVLTTFISASLFETPVNATSMISNSLLVPLVSLITVPAILFSALSEIVLDAFLSSNTAVYGVVALTIQNAAMQAAAWSVQLMLQVMTTLDAQIWQMSFDIGHQPFALLLSLVLGLTIFTPLITKKGLLHVLSLTAAVSTVLAFPFDPSDKKTGLGLTVLDVGQGLAVHVSTQEHEWLFDTGFAHGSHMDAGRDTIVPYLRARRRELDAILISHWDQDHAGGLASVLAMHPKAKLFADMHEEDSGESRFTIRPHRCRDAELSSHDHQKKRVKLELLWPYTDAEAIELSSNDRSCVYLLTVGQYTILLLGDISSKIERKLVRELRLPEEIDVLIAAHHGSRYSSSPELVDAINAKHVVFSAGRYNHYGHPAAEVMTRFSQSGAQIHNTGTDGSFFFPF